MRLNIIQIFLSCAFLSVFYSPTTMAYSFSGPGTSDDGAYTISWDTLAGAELLERKNSGSWKVIGNLNGSSRSFSGKSDGVYSYKSRINVWGYVDLDTISVTVANAPGLPASITTNPSPLFDGNFDILWGSATGNVDGYELSVQNAVGVWEVLYDGSDLSHPFSDTTPGDYVYRVRACNTVGSFTACGDGNELQVSVPDAIPSVPNTLAFSPGYPVPHSEYQISWSESAGPVTHYEVEELPGGNTNWVVLGSTQNLVFAMPGRVAGEYQYRVRACGGQGCSEYSDALDITVENDTDGDAVSDAFDAYPEDANLWSEPVGSINGDLNVSASGALTYSVPIPLPPGRGKLAPQLSLNYNSQSGSGIAGYGWSLSGLSAITRCPRTLAQDGEIKAVDFTASDRFCLDGQRLIAISGDYGQPYTEYRTEIDNFSRVRSYGIQGAGPMQFVVETKAGERMEYGFTDDSRVEGVFSDPARDDIRFWALSRIEDSAGNYLTVTYNEDNATGEHTATSIEYSGHISGALPHTSVQFNYEARADTRVSYQAGAKVTSSVRLVSVNTGSADIRLTYADTSATALSRLERIEHCGASINSPCFDPLEFNWELPQVGFFDDNSFNPPTDFVDEDGRSEGLFLHDVNGDGLVDLVSSTITSQKTWINTGSGWQFSSAWTLPENAGNNMRGIWFLDLNGDGRIDVLRNDMDSLASGSFTVDIPIPRAFINTGSGWIEDSTFLPPMQISHATATRLIDLNGDGLSDFIYGYYSGSNHYKYAYLNTGSGWQSSSAYHPPASIAQNGKDNGVRLMDVNGDGLPDFLFGRDGASGNDTRAWINTGSGWQSNDNWKPPQEFLDDDHYDRGARLVDVNGDGLPDFLYGRKNESGNNYESAWLNTGEGWVGASQYAPPLTFVHDRSDEHKPSEDLGLRFADVNGDGLVDLIRGRGGYQYNTYLNTGNGWESGTSYAPPMAFVNSDGEDKGVRLADLNGDGVVDFIRGKDGTRDADLHNTGTLLITDISDGLGATTSIIYESLSGADHYSVSNTTDITAREVRFPDYTVKRVDVPNGQGSTSSTSYAYQGLKFHPHGLGRLGFESMTITNDVSGVYTTTTYQQTYPFIGLVDKSETFTPEGTLLNRSEHTYAHQQFVTPDASERGYVNKGDSSDGDAPEEQVAVPVFIYAEEKTEATFHVDDSFSTAATTTVTTTTSFAGNNYGHPTLVTVSTSDGSETYQTVTANTYAQADTVNWYLGRLERAQVQNIHADGSVITRTSGFIYDHNTGFLTHEITEPDSGDVNIRQTVAYEHDIYGNRGSATLCEGSVEPNTCEVGIAGSRTTHTSYTSNDASYGDGHFATAATNALGHQENHYFDYRFGVSTQLTGPNQLSTTWQYDDLGRKLKETRSVGTAQENSTVWITRRCDSDICSGDALGAVYQSVEVSDGGPANITYHDQLNRAFLKQTFGFDGRAIFVKTIFDSRGRAVQVSEPYYDGDTPVYTVSVYDNLDRVQSVSMPLDGNGTVATVETDYLGFSTESRDAKGRSHIKTVNVLGQTVSTTNADNNTLSFAYDAKGNLLTTTDSENNTIALTYDDRDRKVTMSDPDMGDWIYAYNGFGELVTQTDAKGQVTRIVYDVLGRMTSRTDLADTAGAVTSTWEYFDDPVNDPLGSIGKLKSMVGPNGSQRSFTYSATGLPLTSDDTIDGNNFTTQRSYDSLGRVDVLTYPTGFAVKHHYTTLGFLNSVQNTNGHVYWQAEDINARGQLVEQTFGNSTNTVKIYNPATGWLEETQTSDALGGLIHYYAYDFDEVGNIVAREDMRQNYTENFQYDSLDRITQSSISGGPQDGNVGHYAYDALGNIIEKDGQTYTYGAHISGGAGPHAVISKGGYQYSYDANGNMVAGAGRSITYSAFNKPTLIQDSNTGNTVEFIYGADRSRIQKISGSHRTTYIGLGAQGGTLYQKTRDASNAGDTGKHEHFIYAGGGLVATYIDDRGSESTQYFVKDHLGSIDAITDALGQVETYKSYDAFGKARQPNWDPAPIGSLVATAGNFGFTGHEEIGEVGLIHMNGRVYDAELGRFLSADPHIQFDKVEQSYNRYTYVNNNPLRYNDPSGYFLRKVFKELGRFLRTDLGKVVSLALTVWTGVSIDNVILSGMASGAVGGALGGLGATGTLEGALSGGFQGALQGAISAKLLNWIGGEFNPGWKKNLAHGFAGGLGSELRGGKFSEGFAAGFFTEALQGPIGRLPEDTKLIAAMAAGGTASVLSGGKFVNGALTAAFARMYNHGHDQPSRKKLDKMVDDSVEGDIEVVGGEVTIKKIVSVKGKVVYKTNKTLMDLDDDSIHGEISMGAKGASVKLKADHVPAGNDQWKTTVDYSLHPSKNTTIDSGDAIIRIKAKYSIFEVGLTLEEGSRRSSPVNTANNIDFDF